ncbi:MULTISPECIES: CHAT domain-containing protein [unclassified Coleofasciculus]|nr:MULTISPECIES: CHAT domain-containing protein [unclassified Coleofasciculus]
MKSAIASLWYVSDEGTLALMSQFYDQWLVIRGDGEWGGKLLYSVIL